METLIPHPVLTVKSTTKNIAFLGDYVPRQCGIATFTAALSDAISSEFREAKCIVGAVNDHENGYDYPERVRFEIDEQEEDSYRRAADYLNINNVEVVSVQHEFGIYGGPAGSHLLTFLRNVRIPVVTTLHTVLREPTREQRLVMKELNEHTDRFVVMAERGRHLLETVYGISPHKVDLIPHGVVDVPFIDPLFYKDLFGVEGKTVLLTFGLLSPNKGIEHVIEAMPAILEKNPNVVYLVVGVTHPNILNNEGDAYRDRLKCLAADLGVEESVVFHNRFVSLKELTEFISGADIYITPYLDAAQITSGTLSLAFGAGKAVISTPYLHAQELLAGDRGILVPFADSRAIADGVNYYLANPTVMTATRKRAWLLGRGMTWPVVAQHYMASFERARTHVRRPRHKKVETPHHLNGDATPFPPFNLEHLFRMSDHTGIFQHAVYNVPNFHEGYCTDDNARAFILTLLLKEMGNAALPQGKITALSSTYLAFLWYAFDQKSGRFRNFMGFDRQWQDQGVASEDSHGRALWAIGTALGRSEDNGHRSICGLLFQRGLPAVEHFTAPRAWAFALLAIHEYLRMFSGDRAASQMREELTTRLADLLRANASPDWYWFESKVTYDNAKLSHALILSGYWTSRRDVLALGLDSLRWLLKVQTGEEGHFSPIGSNGFWERGGERARFDQQPLEAYAMIAACAEAFSATRDDFWLTAAHRCFDWFLGRNDLGKALYDARTGGCRDALQQDRLNANQGAESSLSFYLSLVEINLIDAAQTQSCQPCLI